MTFADLYKYNVNDLLKIETTNHIHQCYVRHKGDDYIRITSYYPIFVETTYYNNSRIEFYDYDIISISKINEFLYNNSKYCYLNKEVMIKNNQWNDFKKYDGIKGEILYISNDLDRTYRIDIKFNDYQSKYNHIEIIPIVDSEKIYKPKTKVLDEKIIIKFDDFC